MEIQAVGGDGDDPILQAAAKFGADPGERMEEQKDPLTREQETRALYWFAAEQVMARLLGFLFFGD